IAEINRVATQTEFNGLKVLDGSFTSQSFQVGANYGQTIEVDSIKAATAYALGLTGGELMNYETTVTMTDVVADGDLKINGVDIAASNSAIELAAAITTSGAGVTATAGATTTSGTVSNAGNVASLTINGV